MKQKILVADKMHESLADLLDQVGYSCDYRPMITREEIISCISDYIGLIIRSKTQVDHELLADAANLKFVGRAGAGVDQIDVDLLQELGIVLYNAPEGNRDALGEHAIGMLLSVMHKIHSADQEIRLKQWRREPNRGMELKGKTVGIFGFGYMGSSVAEKLAGFGCRVIGFDKYKSGFGNKSIREVSIETFCEETEILSLHVPLTDETRQLIDESWLARFARLKILLNTARGEVLVLEDILKMLQSGRLYGAAFDVLENEQFDRYTKKQVEVFETLAKLPNVLFTPHVGGWTFESYQKINEVLVEKISNGKHI